MKIILAEDTKDHSLNTKKFQENYKKYISDYSRDHFFQVDIPYFKGDFLAYALKDEIHEWFNHYDYSYKIILNHFIKDNIEYVEWYLDMENDIAVLFKLTWM